MIGYTYMETHATEAEVRTWIARVGDPAYLYRQALAEVSLTALGAERQRLGPEGRAFGPNAEVRWRQTGPDTFSVLRLTEDPQRFAEAAPKAEFTVETAIRDDHGARVPLRVYLLGVWQPELQAWIEVRIPQPLDYPVTGPTNRLARPALSALEYRQAGRVQYLRYTGFDVVPIQGA